MMLLEGLQAGIAGQLAVLDDAGLTGTGQSSAEVMGVPGAVLVDRLTEATARYVAAVLRALDHIEVSNPTPTSGWSSQMRRPM